MSRRTGIILALVGIALALIGGIFVGSLFWGRTTTAPTPTPPPPLTESVVVVTHSPRLPLDSAYHPLTLHKEYRHGDSCISVYRKEGSL